MYVQAYLYIFSVAALVGVTFAEEFIVTSSNKDVDDDFNNSSNFIIPTVNATDYINSRSPSISRSKYTNEKEESLNNIL